MKELPSSSQTGELKNPSRLGNSKIILGEGFRDGSELHEELNWKPGENIDHELKWKKSGK
ncbi:hypothetical protein MTR_2g021227 [Medicago truncatula]|uniref:Uncharacterized protein n=1 Tax=Medicago truncatula TaxID=3880 RepID=A0A072V4I5_MEDTR|nr:hypothetical protein MTR_2g021227 [Medicago truncatula]